MLEALAGYYRAGEACLIGHGSQSDGFGTEPFMIDLALTNSEEVFASRVVLQHLLLLSATTAAFAEHGSYHWSLSRSKYDHFD